MPIPHGSLVEYLAVRLLLERVAAQPRPADRHEVPVAPCPSSVRHSRPSAESQGWSSEPFGLFQLAQVLGWSPNCLYGLSPTQWGSAKR
ncbi:MAG: hypothetical protein R3B96_15505 [Pirellulaceae bacterium]